AVGAGGAYTIEAASEMRQECGNSEGCQGHDLEIALGLPQGPARMRAAGGAALAAPGREGTPARGSGSEAAWSGIAMNRITPRKKRPAAPAAEGPGLVLAL